MQVLIAGHVPPGVCGRGRNVSWMRPSFNRRLVGLLRQYHNIIVAAIFGHEHTDSFRVLYDSGESLHPLFVNLLSVSITALAVRNNWSSVNWRFDWCW